MASAGSTEVASSSIGSTVGPSNYSSVRGRFVTGDLLCFRGRGFVSQAIRWLTRSRYSHVGIVYLFEERVYCLEATGHGVRLILMSELVHRLRGYHGGIDYFELLDFQSEQRTRAISFCFQQLGKQYSQRGIVRFLLFLLFGNKSRARHRGHWFCSEIVAEAYRLAGADLSPSASRYTSPGDLAHSSRVKFAFRVKRERRS